MRRVVAPDTICVLLVQGALSFSDIDRGGWALALVAIYIAAVLIYIKFRTPHHERAMRELALLVGPSSLSPQAPSLSAPS